MNRKILLIIGIVLFILIVGASYNQVSLGSKDNNYTNEISEKQIGDIVYRGKFPIPVENFIKVTSGFGSRNPTQIISANHHGIDLVGNINSKIISVQDGEITYAGWQRGYGNCIEIKHTDESGKTFYTFYAHMQNNSLQVVTGQKIMLGQVLGVQGSTGNSTGDHLHFEIRLENKTQIDPAPYLFEVKEMEAE